MGIRLNNRECELKMDNEEFFGNESKRILRGVSELFDLPDGSFKREREEDSEEEGDDE